MKPSRSNRSPELPPQPSLLRAILCVAGGVLLTGAMLQTVLQDRSLFAAFGSERLWEGCLRWLGVRVDPSAPPESIEVGLEVLLPLLSAITALAWFGGAALIRRRRGGSFSEALASWGAAVSAWWLLPGAWELLRIVAAVIPWPSLELLLREVPQLVLAVAFAGSMTAFLSRLRPHEQAAAGSDTPANGRGLRFVLAAAAAYAVIFTAMNWQLYRGLLIPHGDTAMYEEHLWNLLHGKGFRSYLDQGLFLGEHIQVIHALLIPVYILWPSHLLLELCSSVALASATIPVYFLARRHSGSDRAGVWMALAYLLAFPMQFLDIAIDLKTFRPTSFVIPLLLFALDQMERGRWKTMGVLLVVTLSAQEDLAIILAPLGLWMAVTSWWRSQTGRSSPAAANAGGDPRPIPIALGLSIALAATAYLALALTVLIPYFRAGAEVHYTTYFGQLGNSPRQIAASLFTQPGAVFGKLLSRRSFLYAVLLLVPYGFIPLRSAGRLLVAAPLFGILCLMDTSRDPASQGTEMLVPFHHFHAPLVPIIVWAACAGLCRGRREAGSQGANATGASGAATPGIVLRFVGSIDRARERIATFIDRFWPANPAPESARGLRRARFAAWCALATGLFFTFSPVGIAFWDPGSPWHWNKLYVPGPRATYFPRVLEQIPVTARVASTDFVHPRFTHFERSYDYSQFRRKVSGNELRAPDDTDFIVIDTQHRYSTVKKPEQVRELREEPERWELLPDVTEGYFLVLRRR